jgi:hypothetical protein
MLCNPSDSQGVVHMSYADRLINEAFIQVRLRFKLLFHIAYISQEQKHESGQAFTPNPKTHVVYVQLS